MDQLRFLHAPSALVLLSFLAAGCRSLGPDYAMSASWEQKDVLLVRVFVGQELDTEEYLAISRVELDRLRTLSDDPGIPLYEVRFDFYRRKGDEPFHTLLARVLLYPSAPSTAVASEERVFLF
jgi:hypothetical protein